MVAINVAPFRTVPDGPETIAFLPSEIEGLPWEAAASIVVRAATTVDGDECRRLAGLPADAPLQVALEAWCDSTYWSACAVANVPEGVPTVTLELSTPPGAVYGKLQHRRLLILGADVPDMSPDVASRRGSILAASLTSAVTLSGEGGQFPTQPVDFAAAGLAPDARWALRFRHESPEDPVLGTVALLLNEAAPAVRILRGQGEASEDLRRQLGRELRRFLVAQIIREAVLDEQLDPTIAWPEHSVGDLMLGIVDRFTGGRTLEQLRTMAKADRQAFEAVLDGGVPDVL